MIAHRLQTIKTAENLLFLEDTNSVLAAQKGTEEYDSLIERLISTNYAHQKDEEESPSKELAVNTELKLA